MLRVSYHELAFLNIVLPANIINMLTSSSTTSSAPEVFLINPFATNINLSLAEGSKIYIKQLKAFQEQREFLYHCKRVTLSVAILKLSVRDLPGVCY